MRIDRPLLGLVLSFLFILAVIAAPMTNSAVADTLSGMEPVQIAQSDEEKPQEAEDDLGEDDC